MSTKAQKSGAATNSPHRLSRIGERAQSRSNPERLELGEASPACLASQTNKTCESPKAPKERLTKWPKFCFSFQRPGWSHELAARSKRSKSRLIFEAASGASMLAGKRIIQCPMGSTK